MAPVNRNSTTDALILSCKQSGENNRAVTMLTRNAGLVRATLYGGGKSRFRSLVSPYHTGKIWLYTDAQKHFIKITDFDVHSFRPSLRENLYKSWAASLCAEITFTTHSGGEAADFDEVFTLVNGFLDGLDLSDEQACKSGLLRFLWRYLLFLGLQPDTAACVKCGKTFSFHSDEQTSAVSFYSPQDLGFVCNLCGNDYGAQLRAQFPVSEKVRVWFEGINKKTPKEARALQLDEGGFRETQTLLFYLIERACGGKLRTLEY